MSSETSPFPWCPFAAVGHQGTAACPGFRGAETAAVELPWHPGRMSPSALSCGHLRSQATDRGWRAACAHPGGLPEGATDRADWIEG